MRRGAETLFLGSFTNKIDAKGRIAAPARFRRVLELEKSSSIFVIPAENGRLDCGGADYIEGLYASIEALDPYSKEREALEQNLIADINELSMDGEGRVVLPQHLRDHAELDGHGLFAGAGVSFQIWNPERFAAARAETAQFVKPARAVLRNPGAPA